MKLSTCIAMVAGLVALAGCAPAGQMESTKEFVGPKLSGRYSVAIAESPDGNLHIAYKGGGVVGYTKIVGESGSTQRSTEIVPMQQTGTEIRLALFGNGAVLLYKPTHCPLRFVLIDESGAVIDTGSFPAGLALPMSIFYAPDGNPVVWSGSAGKDMSPRFNLSTILELGDAKLYSFSQSIGALTVGTADAHMVGDSNIYVFTHRYAEPPREYKKGEIDWATLAIYRYDTWLGRITSSTIIPLDKNPDILSDDSIPFDGVQVVDDTSGNMIVFASYVDPEYGLHLRVFTLTPDLKVLPAPKYDIKREQPSIEIAKGAKQKRLFWFTHNYFWGTTTGFHQIALVGDTLLHQRIYDIPTSQKEIEEQGW